MAAAKIKEIHRIEPRAPRQERSRQKVELMLEAATRILEKDGMEGLTTNAIAAKAGVCIGTLYQYFPHKEAILDALAAQELLRLHAIGAVGRRVDLDRGHLGSLAPGGGKDVNRAN